MTSTSLSFETTRFWQKSLAHRSNDDHEKARELLRNTFLSFRQKAEVLVGEIARDLPDLTVHDISHIDALWEMADLIAGVEIQLTPAEAFVLGGAFLLHDSAMSMVAYPGGLTELRSMELWREIASSTLRQSMGAIPSTAQIEKLEIDVEQKVIQNVLRENHALQAEELALMDFKDKQGNSTYLIENLDLRVTYGRIIGLIAHSHWWPIEQVGTEFSSIINAPGFLPSEWTVDPLKIACLLRGADVCHLDERRAPDFLRSLRKPEGISEEHWVFQGHLQRPRIEVDRLVFSSTHFPVEHSEAWWRCFDALKMVDDELRHIDSLLADLKQPRLAARSVANIDSPIRLARNIPTLGWTPVDAHLKVSNVAALVRHLGGESLYGEQISVPLRELVQNAADAVRARRLLEERSKDWGDVHIRLGHDEEGHWIEVEDNGVGMSPSVLSTSLLDFGTSFWMSDAMRKEFPGLASQPFQSTGKYGIGFFSLFMWGEHVRVSSRRYEAAQQETHVLEFKSGLSARPLLRKAQKDEYLRDGGTRVRVWTKDIPEFPRIFPVEIFDGDLWRGDIECAQMFPTVDVNLHIQSSPEPAKLAVRASDWIDMPGDKLLARLGFQRLDDSYQGTNLWSQTARNLRLLTNSDGQIVGRACIAVPLEEYYGDDEIKEFNVASNGSQIDESPRSRVGIELNHDSGMEAVVVSGGNSVGRIMFLSGVFLGSPTTASRSEAWPIVEPEALADWATEQAKLARQVCDSDDQLFHCAEIVRFCGGDVGDLPIASDSNGFKNRQDIQLNFLFDEILVCDSNFVLSDGYSTAASSPVLHKNVLVSSNTTPVLFEEFTPTGRRDFPSTKNDDNLGFNTCNLMGAVIEALSSAWACSVEEVVKVSDTNNFPNQKLTLSEVGMSPAGPVFARSFVIRRPLGA